jgi:hypothetical protein
VYNLKLHKETSVSLRVHNMWNGNKIFQACNCLQLTVEAGHCSIPLLASNVLALHNGIRVPKPI